MNYVLAWDSQSQVFVICEHNALGKIVARFPATAEGRAAAEQFVMIENGFQNCGGCCG